MRRAVERLGPRRLPELPLRVGGVRRLGRILAPHQRHGEPIWMESVVPAEATFHTETAAVRWAIDSLCPCDAPVRQVVAYLAHDAAVRAQAVDAFSHRTVP